MINVFPNFGRKKNEPIEGAPLQELEYYRNACINTLNNPDKQQWHAVERERLQAIEQEIARNNQRRLGTPAPQNTVTPQPVIQRLSATCPHCHVLIAITVQR